MTHTMSKSSKRTGSRKVKAKRKKRSRPLTAQDMAILDGGMFQIRAGYAILSYVIYLLDRLSRGLAIGLEQDMMEAAEAPYPLG